MNMKNIYLGLPPVLQDAAIGMLGAWRRLTRFGPAWTRLVDGLMESQWWSAERHRRNQLTRLRQMIAEIGAWCPYYRELFTQHRITPHSVRSLDDLRTFPLLEKHTLRARLTDFHNQAPWRKTAEVELTSGSTGTPLRIPADAESMATAVALLERQYRWAGVSFFNRHVRLAGALLTADADTSRPYRYNYPWNQLLCSSYHLTEANLPRMARAIAEFRPKYMHCYPSAGYVLARWVNSVPRWRRRVRLLAVFCTAETLADYQRAEMEHAFGCTVFNHYGSAEGAPFIGQCQAGRLHISMESGIVEFLLPDGSAAAPGQQAEMVVTSFRSMKVPLVRYRIGDYAVASDELCPCGRQMTVVCDIVGRQDDLMVTSERGIVGRLSQITKVAVQAFVESQIEQVAMDDFVFRYVPAEGFFEPARDLKAVEAEMKLRLGRGIKVTFQSVDRIPRGAHGKFRAMIGLPRSSWPAGYCHAGPGGAPGDSGT